MRKAGAWVRSSIGAISAFSAPATAFSFFGYLLELGSNLFTGPLGESVLHRRLHFFGRHVLDVGCERPLMAERIDDDAVPVAPEHVPGRHEDGRAGVLGSLDRGVAVLDIVMQRHRRA